MASSSQTATATGSCLCQSVQYTLTGVDKGAVLCHCDNCQRVTGSAFAHNYRFLKSNIAFQKGEELVKSYLDSNTKSGNPLKRHFCSNCGSSIYLVNPAVPDLIVLHSGCMNELRDTKPKMELFQHNKKPWFDSVAKAAKM